MRTMKQAVIFSLLLLICGYYQKASGAIIPKNAFITDLTGAATLTLEDDMAANNTFNFNQNELVYNSNWFQKGVTDIITFKYDAEQAAYFNYSFTASVTVSITYLTYTDYQNTNTTGTTINGVTLNLSYDNTAGAVLKDKDVFNLAGLNAYKVIVHVTSALAVTPSANQAAVSAICRIDCDMSSERYGVYKFDPPANPVLELYNCSSVNYRDLICSWSSQTASNPSVLMGAPYYDIEWTYVNDYSGDATNPFLLTTALNYDFRANSTMVRVPDGVSYDIPMVFEHGYILFRVRAVYYLPGDRYAEGSWSATDYGTVASFATAQPNSYFHNDGTNISVDDRRNWQLISSFAEEGKHKEVLSYYDGTMRKRQTLTRLNSESDVNSCGTLSNTLVQETIYDELGRPGVQVLPASSSTSDLIYQFKFNREDVTHEPYTYKDFSPGNGVDFCNPVAKPMEDVVLNSSGHLLTGAAYYYSANNTDKGRQQACLPDAKKYPFSQTQYTPDNTGRIKSQGGVGADLQIDGSKKHFSKYYYSKPSQDELDQMFGNEAGYSQHYKKNMVVDPNGQVSISYLDPKGNVIATALSGATDGTQAPASMDALLSNPQTAPAVSMDFLDNNTMSLDDGTVTATQTILVTAPNTTYSFTYSVTGDHMAANCLGTICKECKYNINVSVFDECGNYLPNQPNPVFSYSMGGLDDNINPATGTQTFSVIFPTPGTYTVTKVLSVDQSAIDAYVNTYMASSSCFASTLSGYQTTEFSNYHDDCNMDCQTCRTRLGDYNDALKHYNDITSPSYLTQAQYDKMLADCDALPVSAGCLQKSTSVNPCDNMYQAMMMDVSPGGQYAEYIDPLTGNPVNYSLNPNIFPLSVLNLNNSLNGSNHNWQHPYFPYENEDGTSTKILLQDLDDPSTYSAVICQNCNYVTPDQLTLADFVKFWKASWARSLVYYHPEYGYYLWCNDVSTSNAFDEALNATTGDATSYVTEMNTLMTGGPQSSMSDPFFTTGNKGAGFRTNMSNDMLNYYTFNDGTNTLTLNILQMAVVIAGAGSQATGQEMGQYIQNNPNLCNYATYPALYPWPTITWNIPPASKTNLNSPWSVLKSLYLSLKHRFMFIKRSDDAIYGGFYNECMNNEFFNPGQVLQSGQINYLFFNPGYLNTGTHLCNVGNQPLYAFKIPRYPSDQYYDNIGVNIYADASTGVKNFQKYAQEKSYARCGDCPAASDFKNLLTSLFTNGFFLQTNIPVNNFVSKAILDQWEGNISPHSTFYWDARYSTPTTFEGMFRKTGYSCCFNLKTGTRGIDWTKVIGINNITIYPETPGANTTAFSAVLILDNGMNSVYNEVKVNGSSCINLNCSAPVFCKKTKLAIELQNMFNKLVLDGKFATGGAIDPSYTPLIADLYPNATSWGMTPGTGTIHFQEGGINTSCNFNFSDPVFNYNTIVSFLDMSLNDDGTITVSVLLNNGTIKVLTMNTNCTAKFFDCDDPEKNCNLINGAYSANDMRRNLLELMNDLAATGIAISQPVKDVPAALVKGSPNFFWTGTNGLPGPPPTDHFTGDLANSGGNYLHLVLDYPDKDRRSPGDITALNYNDIIRFEDLKATPPFNPSGLSNTFTVIAWTRYGTKLPLTGSVTPTTGSGFEIYNCASCPNEVLYWQPVDNTASGTSSQIGCSNGMCGLDYHSPLITVNFCNNYIKSVSDFNSLNSYNNLVDQTRKDLTRTYLKKCLQTAMQNEIFTATHLQREFHRTLYFYDQANNLIKTVPPEGVHLADLTVHGADIRNARSGNGTPYYPVHNMITHYIYNSLNKVTYQKTPEKSTTATPVVNSSTFFYDNLGRLVASQNAKQALARQYSYTLYDAQGRITEVGELTKLPDDPINNLYYELTVDIARSVGNTTFSYWLTHDFVGSHMEITRTFYDNAITASCPTNSGTQCTAIVNAFGTGQQNLRGRVASIIKEETDNPTPTLTLGYDYATHYSYDIHGNVNILVQENPSLTYLGQDIKKMEYYYDLVSGKVNQVYYQRGKADQFIHRYTYDADNRLTKSETSRDGMIWEKESKEFYYRHMPLAREEIGDLKVQGIDYAYTLQGWIKAVNSDMLSADNEMGNDGLATSTAYGTDHSKFARDAFGYSISYFKKYNAGAVTEDDYKSITQTGLSPAFIGEINGSPLQDPISNLYNGNIRHIVTAVGQLMVNQLPLATKYHYDQLNRLKDVNSYTGFNVSTNTWSAGNMTNNFGEHFTYDGNGNILSLNRFDPLGSQIDALDYKYSLGTFGNELLHVKDGITTTPSNMGDIKDEDISGHAYDPNYPNDISTFNDKYDEIGNLIHDQYEEIDNIDWNVYGKIRSITRTSGSQKSNLLFMYGPDGNRIEKIEKPTTDPTTWKTTFYVHDAQGNVMATYNKKLDARVVSDNDFSPLINTADQDVVGNRLDPSNNAFPNYKTFMTNAFSGKQWFRDNLRIAINGAPYTASIVATHTPAWYCAVDPALKTLILSNYTDAALTQASVAQGGPLVMNYIYGNNINLPQLIQAFLDLGGAPGSGANFMTFFQQLDQQYGATPTSYGALFNAIYNPGTLPGLPPPYPPPFPAGYANLMAYYNTNVATVVNAINAFDATSGRMSQNVINNTVNYSAANITSAISTANGGSCSFLHNYLTNLPNIIDLLYADNPSLVTGYIEPSQNPHLLDLYKDFDHSGFVMQCLNNDVTLAYSVINSNRVANNYHIADLIADMKIWLSQSDYAAIMMTYYHMSGDHTDTYTLNELDIYGSKRLGTREENLQLVKLDVDASIDPNTGVITSISTTYSSTSATLSATTSARYLGKKRYELSNHLGNVLAVVSDKKIGVVINSVSTYTAEVISAQYYYAFGSTPPNVTGTGGTASYQMAGLDAYRYGFNGKEKDDEVKGGGNSLDFGARIYDSRLGRWMSMDPLQMKYASLSCYSGFGNVPIYLKDPNGKDIIPSTEKKYDGNDNPQNEHDLGDTHISSLKATFNTKTQSFDVYYTVKISLSPQIDPSKYTIANTFSPGLGKEVNDHEDQHKNQYDELMNSKMTYTYNKVPYEGRIDQILTNINKDNKLDQKQLNAIFNDLAKKGTDLDSKYGNKDAVEKDANERMFKANPFKSYPYTKGEKEIIINDDQVRLKDEKLHRDNLGGNGDPADGLLRR
jgi:RHS repeat-associated protein